MLLMFLNLAIMDVVNLILIQELFCLFLVGNQLNNLDFEKKKDKGVLILNGPYPNPILTPSG